MELIHQTELGRFRERWDHLVLEMAVPSPFLRTWWLDHVSHGEPSYLLAIDGGDLVGGVPLQVQRWHGIPRVQLLSQGPLAPAFGDLVAVPDRGAEVASAVVDWLSTPRAPWRQRVVDLAGLYPDGHLAEALRAKGHALTPTEVAPFADLGSDRAEYLASRPAKLRKSVDESIRRYKRRGVVFRQVPADDLDSGLETLRQLHETRWGDESAFLPMWSPFKAAALAGARAGEADLVEVVGPDGTALASALFLRLGSRLVGYQAGRLQGNSLANGAGVWLYWESLLAWPDAREFDLGPGGQDYKRLWTTGERELCATRFPAGVIAASALAAAKARAEVRREPRTAPDEHDTKSDAPTSARD